MSDWWLIDASAVLFLSLTNLSCELKLSPVRCLFHQEREPSWRASLTPACWTARTCSSSCAAPYRSRNLWFTFYAVCISKGRCLRTMRSARPALFFCICCIYPRLLFDLPRLAPLLSALWERVGKCRSWSWGRDRLLRGGNPMNDAVGSTWGAVHVHLWGKGVEKRWGKRGKLKKTMFKTTHRWRGWGSGLGLCTGQMC